MASLSHSAGKLCSALEILQELNKTKGCYGLVVGTMTNEGSLSQTVEQSNVPSIGTLVFEKYTSSQDATNKVNMIPGKDPSTNAFAAGFINMGINCSDV